MQESQSLDFSRQWYSFLRLLNARRWIILTFLTVTLLLVVVGTSLQTPIYRTSTTVLIDMETPNVLTVSTSASSRDDYTRADVGQSSYMAYADYYRTQVEIIRSRAIAEKVYRNLNLDQNKIYNRSKDPVGKILKQIKVEPIKQTRLAKIYAENSNPQLAAQIANEFGLIFVEENRTGTTRSEKLTLMKNEYLKLQSREAELSKRYKSKFPAMVRVREQMEQLVQSIGKERETEAQLRKSRSKSLTERLQESSTIGLRPNNIRVQDLAEIPIKRYKPSAMLNLMLGLFLGLLGGVGLAVIEELLDNSVKLPEDFEHDPRLVFLGYVPQLNGVKPDARFLYPKQSDSQAAEAFRALRTSLLYTTPLGNAKAVVVTSPGSGEGKTTTLSNLGIALAQIGLKILLVDADMRRPRLHETFQVLQKPGLSEYLTGQAPFDAVVKLTAIKGVWVVPSGISPPNPAELLELPQMKEFLKQATAKFDRVFLDSPPIIPVTDTVVLSALAGTVVAIAKSGKTPRRALHRLVSLVNNVHSKVLGVILNQVPSSDLRDYRYGYSDTDYSYGETKEPKEDKLKNLLKDLKSRLEKYTRLVGGGEEKLPERPMKRDANT